MPIRYFHCIARQGQAREFAVSKLEETVKGLKYDAGGLIPAVIVDAGTRQVLMVACMNEASLLDTIRTGKTHFWSRSRQKHWMKGESSGHTQEVQAIYTDCDKDTLVIEAVQHGAACHEGYFSCFFRKLNEAGEWEVVAEKLFDPDEVYKKK
jgi:phosphoribosyl-AMP cyclohydrolase